MSAKQELSRLLQQVAKHQAAETKKSYTSKLEKMLADKVSFQEELKELVQEMLPPTFLQKNTFKAKGRGPSERELVVMLNDTHYGLIVDPDEVNGLNSYGWKEACRRTALVIQQAITYKPHNKNKISKVNLVICGDTISGIIHGLATKQQDLLTHQLNGAVHIFSHAISLLMNAYPKAQIHVTGISGNHGDMPHKREGNRVVTEKYDSYENIVFYSLSWAFNRCSQVTFNFPKTPYAFLNLPGGRALVCHGDVLFSKSLGNPGKNLNIKGLSEEIHKFSLGETKRGRKPIDLVLLGHVHVFVNFKTFQGTEIFVSPSLSGVDGYAHSLNINDNLTGQVIFESTEDHVIGDRRLVEVTRADKDKSLDKLIPTFKRTLAKQ